MYEIYKRLRDAKGVTDYAVAKACGLKQTTFTEWEKVANGEKGHAPKIDKLLKIARYFDVSLDYLVEGEYYDLSEQQNETLQAISGNKKIGALLSASKDLPPEDLDILVNMAERLRESYRDV